MAAAAYTRLARQKELRDLLSDADFVREALKHPGWKIVEDAIAEHQQKMLDRLLNESTRLEEIPRLRGLLDGLRSMREAAEAILALADEREAEARQKAQEMAHG